MGKRNEGGYLRELQDYFDQRAKVQGENPPLWEHASEMCQAMLQDMGVTDVGPLTSLYTRIIGEMVVSVNKANMAAAVAKENQALLDKQSQEHRELYFREKRKVEEFVEEKKSLDAKVLELQRQVKQSNADEHAALSAVDRLRAELKSAKDSLHVSCDATSRLERNLAEIKRAARLTDGELEALDDANRDRDLLHPDSRLARLAGFVGRARSVLEPHIIDAMPAETEEAPRDGTVAVGPAQRLKAVEQELKFLWPVVNMLAQCSSLYEIRTVAIAALETAKRARKERGG